jgi:hypothetical protein
MIKSKKICPIGLFRLDKGIPAEIILDRVAGEADIF